MDEGFLSADEFRVAMRAWPSGVSVVGTATDGRLVGSTVSAFTSLGVEPPLALICLDNRSRTRAAVAAARRFAVSILAEDQEEFARHFAAPGVVDRFEAVPHRLVDGLPVVEGAAGYLLCETYDAIPAADHLIVLGRPTTAETEPRRQPLVHHRRAYRRITSS